MGQASGKLRWLITSGFIILMCAPSAFGANPVITVQKAADVNGVAISIRDLDGEYTQLLKQQGTSEKDIPQDKVEEIKKEVLDSLINQELLYQESQKKNIVVSQEEIDSSIAKAKAKFDSEEAYQNALKDAGMLESELEARIRRVLAINALVEQQISPKVVVTDEESKAYYDTHPDSFKEPEKVRASHILVKVDKNAGEAEKVAAKEKIQMIQKKLKAGGDFAQLAKEYSDCPSAPNGGDLVYFERGKMVPEFEKAAFALAPGAVSDVVQTDFGYHLIKVVDKKEADTVSYDSVKSDLQAFMKKKKLKQEVTSLLETLRKDAKIETYL